MTFVLNQPHMADMHPGASQPLIPSYVDVSKNSWLPVSLKFLISQPLAFRLDAEAFRAGIFILANGLQQKPSMSLPDDDWQLTAIAGFGRDKASWMLVREDVLRDWVKAEDGRLYHPEYSAWVLQSWTWMQERKKFAEKQSQRARAGVEKRKVLKGQLGVGSELHPVESSDCHGEAAAEPNIERNIDTNINIENKKNKKNQSEKGRTSSGLLDSSFASVEEGQVPQSYETKDELSHCDDPVVVIFNHWKKETNHPREILTISRRKIISERLTDGLSIEILCSAIDGALADDFLQGRTEKSSVKREGLDTIFKNIDRVQTYATQARENNGFCGPELKNAARSTAEVAIELMRMHGFEPMIIPALELIEAK